MVTTTKRQYFKQINLGQNECPLEVIAYFKVLLKRTAFRVLLPDRSRDDHFEYASQY